MPLFDFACSECEHTFELLVNSGETPECPKCRSKRLEKMLSLPARPPESRGATRCMADPSFPPCGPVCRRESN
jgi:putative FmdB family regulatory protein